MYRRLPVWWAHRCAPPIPPPNLDWSDLAIVCAWKRASTAMWEWPTYVRDLWAPMCLKTQWCGTNKTEMFLNHFFRPSPIDCWWIEIGLYGSNNCQWHESGTLCRIDVNRHFQSNWRMLEWDYFFFAFFFKKATLAFRPFQLLNQNFKNWLSIRDNIVLRCTIGWWNDKRPTLFRKRWINRIERDMQRGKQVKEKGVFHKWKMNWNFCESATKFIFENFLKKLNF